MERISSILSRVFGASAIAIAIICSVGSCIKEDLVVEISEQSVGKTIHFTATLAAKGATTRSVDPEGHTAWQVGDEIYVECFTSPGVFYSGAATVTALSGDGSATIEATVPLISDGNYTAYFYYPASLYNTGDELEILRGKQHGNLTGDNGISKLYDAAEGSTTVTVSNGTATTNGRVVMENQLCICKFHLRIGTNGEGNTFTPSTEEFEKLTIDRSGYKKIRKTYTITSDKPKDGGGIRGFMDGDDIYVAMEPIDEEQLIFAVNRTDENDEVIELFTTTTGKGTLESGKFYTNIPIKMTPQVPVTIPAGGSYTLNDASLYYVNSPAIVCEGNAVITLEGDNNVRTLADAKAAIQPGPAGTTLIIQGDGSLEVRGGKHGAAIGSGNKESCGNIEITGGTIMATGGIDAAGIGGGYSGTCGDITISGGSIFAQGGNNAAGIGSGWHGKCGDSTISITGGDVTAIGGYYGAGIGCGAGGNKASLTNYWGPISITGGNITATGGKNAAGIGCGNDYSSCGNITINEATGVVKNGIGTSGNNSTCTALSINGVNENSITQSPYYLGRDKMLFVDNGTELSGTVDADHRIFINDGATVTLRDVTIINGNSWPAITCSGNATIVLEGTNTVTTTSSRTYPAIQPGLSGSYTLTITGTGSLNATGGRYAAGIGSCQSGSCGNIIIESGTVSANGGARAAGIGSGFKGDCGNISITGGIIAATTGKNYGAGIGAASYGSCGDIIISGGNVTATGGKNGAGIGSGFHGKFNSITVTSGITRVESTRGERAKAIGFGRQDEGSGSITVDGVDWKSGCSDTEHLNYQIIGDTWIITPKQ